MSKAVLTPLDFKTLPAVILRAITEEANPRSPLYIYAKAELDYRDAK